MSAPGPSLRESLASVAQALPPGTAVPVPREVLLDLLASEGGGGDAAQAAPDRLLKAPEVAARLGLSLPEVYRQARRWPFARRLARRALRFSEQGLERWLERKRA